MGGTAEAQTLFGQRSSDKHRKAWTQRILTTLLNPRPHRLALDAPRPLFERLHTMPAERQPHPVYPRDLRYAQYSLSPSRSSACLPARATEYRQGDLRHPIPDAARCSKADVSDTRALLHVFRAIVASKPRRSHANDAATKRRGATRGSGAARGIRERPDHPCVRDHAGA